MTVSQKEASGLAAQHEQMLITVPLSIFDALVRVRHARCPAARRARRHFVRREHGTAFERALRLMPLADEATRRVRAPHVPRAVDVLIDGARRPMALAHLAVARRAARHLVAPNNLVRPALALARAVGTQPASTARKSRYASQTR